MTRRGSVLVVLSGVVVSLAALAACDAPSDSIARGGAPAPGGTEPSPSPTTDVPPYDAGGPPLTVQGPAPGLCGRWAVAPVTLDGVPSAQDTARLSVRGDARGGFTIAAVDHAGALTGIALTSAAVADGAPVTFAAQAEGDAGLTADPVGAEAVPDGWLVSLWGSPGMLARYDRTGTPESTIALSPSTESAVFDVAPDGTIGVDDGTAIGWVRPGGAAMEPTFASWQGGLETWLGGTVTVATSTVPPGYIPWPYVASVRTLTPDGGTLDYPCPDFGYADVLVPGVDGKSAAVLSPGYDESRIQLEGSLTATFVSTAFTPRTFTLDAEVQIFAGAPRGASGGAVVAWTTNGLTAGGGAASGLAEIAPTGARGEIVSLGNQVVANTNREMARSGDGAAYLVVGWNASVRTSFLVTCADGGGG